MDSNTRLAHLDRELAAYAEGLGRVEADNLWQTPVSSCPGWSVRDLTHHLIGVHHWVASAVTGVRGNESGPPMPADEALSTAFNESAGMIRELLDKDAETPCWTFGDDQTLGFWQRRQPHEHAIHRWDLGAALGREPGLDALLASDGIDEVVTMFWPRQVALGRADEPRDHVRLVAVDTDQTWLLGNLEPTSEPAATVTANAEDVLLALWKRIPLDSPALAWSGDRAAGSTLLGLKIVP